MKQEFKEAIKSFIDQLQGSEFSIDHDSTNESVTVKETIGMLTLEFLLEYEVKELTHAEATYLQPEDKDYEFTNTSVSEIAVYYGCELIEMYISDVYSISCILEEKLL